MGGRVAGVGVGDVASVLFVVDRHFLALRRDAQRRFDDAKSKLVRAQRVFEDFLSSDERTARQKNVNENADPKAA